MTPPRGRGLAIVLLCVLTGQGCRDPSRAYETQRTLLEAEAEHLRGYLQEAAAGDGLVSFDDVAVGIRPHVLHGVLSALLPRDVVVEERLQVRLERARVAFRNGLALVRLEGRAHPVGSPSTYGAFLLSGSFEVLGIEPGAEVLRTRVRVFGVHTRDIGMGPVRPPVERLLDELAPETRRAVESVLARIEVPVGLEEVVRLPRVAEEEVTIPADSLRLGLELRRVTVLEDRLWIEVGVRLAGMEPDGRSTGAPGIGARRSRP